MDERLERVRTILTRTKSNLEKLGSNLSPLAREYVVRNAVNNCQIALELFNDFENNEDNEDFEEKDDEDS